MSPADAEQGIPHSAFHFPHAVDIVQLREKSLPDRELVELGRRVCAAAHAAGKLFIMNDRPDLAVLTGADGVHVGQDELGIRDARRIVGPDRLVGVSTHTIAQARQAVVDGADYLGVGPVFPSTTKSFEGLAGLEFVREVAAEISLPWFAIGGIDAGNIEQVLAAGATRVAVSGAVCGAADPEGAAAELRRVISTNGEWGRRAGADRDDGPAQGGLERL
jgi:thiamine-phosphate pyrophosphorylase